MIERSPYDVLGVPVGSTVDEIRQAFLVLARRHHPDFHAGESSAAVAEAGRQMQVLNEAWAALSDPAVRRRYEREAATRFRPFHPPDDGDPDPRDFPDVPYRPVRARSVPERVAVVAPAGLFGGAGASAAIGVATGATGLLALAAVLFVLSCVGFLVVPLLALGRAARDEG